jgi:DNA-binding MarR family transcriptional regulator
VTAGTPVEADLDAFWPAWDTFFAALRRARGRDARETTGLTISQFHLLCAVEANPKASLRELGDHVGSSAPTITRMLGILERAGIVRREAAEQGQRRVCVTLTESGRTLLAAKQAEMAARRAVVFASLTPEERDQLQRLLPRMAEALDAL